MTRDYVQQSKLAISGLYHPSLVYYYTEVVHAFPCSHHSILFSSVFMFKYTLFHPILFQPGSSLLRIWIIQSNIERSDDKVMNNYQTIWLELGKWQDAFCSVPFHSDLVCVVLHACHEPRCTSPHFCQDNRLQQQKIGYVTSKRDPGVRNLDCGGIRTMRAFISERRLVVNSGVQNLKEFGLWGFGLWRFTV